MQLQYRAPGRVALNWGDARLPNLIFRDDRVAAVLDWEMAFLGDPEADLAWWLFLDWQGCDGYGIPRLDGFPSREQTVRTLAAPFEMTLPAVSQQLQILRRAGLVTVRRAGRWRAGHSSGCGGSPVARRAA